MASAAQRKLLCPPKEVVISAKAVMGGIDFDPVGSVETHRLTNAIRYFNRDQMSTEEILAEDWKPPGQRRTFFAAILGATEGRQVLNRILREYRAGSISQAVLWVSHNETLLRCPWLHDFPICFPFRRLRPCWYDDETDMFRNVGPADWSFVAYLPPADNAAEWFTKVSRFHSAFSHLGRIVLNEYCGETDWEASYKEMFKKAYSYRS